jgi:hypothetical protein
VININGNVVSTAKVTDPSVASVCSLGFSRTELTVKGLPGAIVLPSAVLPSAGFAGLPVLAARDERPMVALDAGAAAVEAQTYAYAAASAERKRQTTQHHHKMWAIRGLEPWSDPA